MNSRIDAFDLNAYMCAHVYFDELVIYYTKKKIVSFANNYHNLNFIAYYIHFNFVGTFYDILYIFNSFLHTKQQ